MPSIESLKRRVDERLVDQGLDLDTTFYRQGEWSTPKEQLTINDCHVLA